MKSSAFFKLAMVFFSSIGFLVSGCNPANTGASKEPGQTSNRADMYLFVGTYTNLNSSTTDTSVGIYVLKLNMSTGVITNTGISAPSKNPSFISLHPKKHYLYAVNENGGKGPMDFGSVSAFRIDSNSHQLQFLNKVSSMGKDPCYISLVPSGNFALVANYSSGNVCLFPLNNDGTLKEASSVLQDQGKGPDAARQEGPHAHMISPDPAGKFIYATDLGTDQLMSYNFDEQKMALTSTGHTTSLTAGAGPRHIAFHPNQSWIYIVNELNGTIEAFKQNISTGILSRFQVISTLPAGTNIQSDCADIHITPSGKYLYASNRGENNSIAMYSVNETTGELSLIGHQSTKGKTPRNFAIDPSGTFLLVANQNSSNIVAFRIDPSTGKLIDTNQEIHIPMPVCIKFEVQVR